MTEEFPEIIELLHILKNKDNIIDNINYEIESILLSKSELYEVKGNCYDGMPKGTKNSDTSNRIAKIIDIYDKRISELEKEIININKKCEICNILLDELEPAEKNIICLFYLKKIKWKSIEKITSYSERHCRRIKNKALKKMNCTYKTKFASSGFVRTNTACWDKPQTP